MSFDVGQLLHDAAGDPKEQSFDAVWRRSRQLHNRRTAVVTGALVSGMLSVVFLMSMLPLAEVSDQAIPPANPRPEGIFADVGGWIAFGNRGGIFAVDPTQPGGDPADRVRLSSTPGTPRAWSPDGSKLLILRNSVKPARRWDYDLLVVLNADGTETRLAKAPAHSSITGGSFSRDGTEVVYAETGDERSAIFMVDAEGGAPRRLRSAEGVPGLYAPTFSPDGDQIAYFEGGGDHDHSLRVMNPDGSGDRELVLIPEIWRSISNLVWSPDGSRLMISKPAGVMVVGADGTGLKVMSEVRSGMPEADPHWSPDGSRISYNSPSGTLAIAGSNGTQVQFDHGRSGPWISTRERSP